MRIGIQTILTLAAAGTVVLGLTGCNYDFHKAHKQEVTAANSHWKSMRSGLMLNMAQQQFETGDLEQAEKTLAEAIGIDPGNARLHVLAGRVAIEQGLLERAAERLTRAQALNPELPEAFYYQGLVLQRWQRYDQALISYQKAFALRPDDPAYLLAVSEMLMGTDKVDEALALLNEKCAYFDQSAGVRNAIGQLYSVKGDHEKAASFFQQALLLAPDDLQVAENLANEQLAAGHFDKAIMSLESLCKDPRLVARRDLQRTLGGAYASAGRIPDARAAYLKLTRSDPNDVDSWVALAELAWSQNDANGTLLAANRVIALAPQRQDGYLLAGMVWQSRGNVDEALRSFDRAAEAAPTSTEPVILRGITLERAGRSKAAAQAYNEALRRQPNDERAQKLLAQLSSTER